jgi:hypothetical protein
VAGEGGVMGSLLREPVTSDARSSQPAAPSGSTTAASGARVVPAAYEEDAAGDFEVDVYPDAGDASEPTGAVFVIGNDGTIFLQPILAGISDWEFTEIQAGLTGNEQIVILPSTSLLRSQEELRDRFNSRSAIPGMSGGGGGRRMGG